MSFCLLSSKFKSFACKATLGFAISFAFCANVSAKDYSVALNRTQILHLPGPASTIVIGDPSIADISIHSSDTVFIVGRGYGVTNVIALDENGQTMMDANIIVTAAKNPGTVRLLNIGQGQESYNCTPNCLPAPVLGDQLGFIAQFSGQAQTINNLSSGANGSPNGINNSSSQPHALSALPPANAQFSGPAPEGYEGDGFESGFSRDQ